MQSLETFFGIYKGNYSMADFLTLWKLAIDDALTTGGLDMNPIGKSFLLLRAAGVSERRYNDLMLQIGNDLRRYNDLAPDTERVWAT